MPGNIMTEIKNRSAFHDYFIEDKYVAGLVLAGTEVKSLRDGRASFNDAFCFFHKNELWIKSLHIAEYAFGNVNNHIAVRERKLLLNRKELKKLEAKLRDKGYSIVPLKIFFTEKGIAKIEIGLGRGKKLFDKRDTIKQRDNDRELKRLIK
jgi:SsrA-binding protein